MKKLLVLAMVALTCGCGGQGSSNSDPQGQKGILVSGDNTERLITGYIVSSEKQGPGTPSFLVTLDNGDKFKLSMMAHTYSPAFDRLVSEGSYIETTVDKDSQDEYPLSASAYIFDGGQVREAEGWRGNLNADTGKYDGTVENKITRQIRYYWTLDPTDYVTYVLYLDNGVRVKVTEMTMFDFTERNEFMADGKLVGATVTRRFFDQEDDGTASFKTITLPDGTIYRSKY